MGRPPASRGSEWEMVARGRNEFWWVVVVVMMVTGGTGAAQDNGAQDIRHIRTAQADLRALMLKGLDRSETLRALVARLTRSDVIVYVEYGFIENRLSGRLTWIGSTQGARYLRIQLDSR